MVAKSQNRATTKYVKNTYKRFEIRVRQVEEINIIEHLSKQSSVNDYIKRLILNDIEAQKKS